MKKSIQINILPVGKGDCIHIRLLDETGNYNIIIDSGPIAAARSFRDLLQKIDDNDEQVDLLCFTHIDDDHIGAATRVFADESFDCSYIKTVWLNYYLDDNVSQEIEASGFSGMGEMSVSNMLDLYRYLVLHQVKSETDIISGCSLPMGTGSLKVMTPSKVDHEAYRNYIKEKLEHQKMSTTDRSETNGDSISLLLCFDTESFLFTGDIHPDKLSEGLKSGIDKPIYCTQLPHHGSHRNITPELLQQMDTTRFIVSYDGSADKPSVKTIRLLEEYRPNDKKVLMGDFRLFHTINDPDHLSFSDLTEAPFSDQEGIIVKSEV